jgi:ferredoxin/flavodoxin---NADP+ reductase
MIDPQKYASATIVSRRDLAPDLWVIRLRPEVELQFRPGQYVTIGLPHNGRVIERPYSICSSPAEEEIELFIERVPEGELSEPLYGLDVGSEMVVRKRTKGLFLKDAPLESQPHLFVATVTGIAPFVSILRSLAVKAKAGEWTPVPVLALQGAAKSEELGYAEELQQLEQEHEWFRYVPTVSRPWEDPEWRGELGRVDDVLRKYAEAIDVRSGHGAAFLCGHPGMIANARAILRRAGLGDKEIREEQYWPE